MLIQADARAIPLRDDCVDCVVTSPPYWGLRDYGVPGQLGLEATPEAYVETMRQVFAEVRRVLKPAGTLWLNLGDCYATGGGSGYQGKTGQRADRRFTQESLRHRSEASGLKPKDLVGVPWRVAFALQADGWWLRSDIVWSKPNPMPESVTDRPTKAHEYVFLLAKSERYWYDAAAIRERYEYGRDHTRHIDSPPESHVPNAPKHTGLRRSGNRERVLGPGRGRPGSHLGGSVPWVEGEGRNARSVWTITTQPYAGAHYATFPPALVRRCILAGCPVGGIVLDPFVGSGTTVKVARELGREGIGIDINPRYLTEQAAKRIKTDRGLPLRSASGAPDAR